MRIYSQHDAVDLPRSGLLSPNRGDAVDIVIQGPEEKGTGGILMRA